MVYSIAAAILENIRILMLAFIVINAAITFVRKSHTFCESSRSGKNCWKASLIEIVFIVTLTGDPVFHMIGVLI
jgi:hypothetical protein